ncbi:hypothetical protein M9H77_18698 [Catharanthus roseus]|uniref:Uncharacterized protein n=1 Tax=Catharanthus roseus TaxID=4058 RepID=A0ACC0B8D4_CATRO|nr:hypothetical protein M9H77_18698 [Catharanthus roseus]
MCSKAIVPVHNGQRVEEYWRHYPPPVASHEQIIKDPVRFWDSLRIFHAKMGTKYMVPVIGGKELNLHVLYAEVTRRGGFEKVVSQKKWREVSSVFKFSPTTTSASYALRKHYFNLLYHYEQVYFCRRMQGPIPMPSPDADLTEHSTSSTTPTKSCTDIVPYTGQQQQQQHSSSTAAGQRKRRKRGDPNRPKPNRSGYNFFFAEKHSILKSLYPNREREFTKMIGESWNNLSPEERIVYQNYGVKDKERYQREMKEYKERLNIANSR